MDANIWIGVGLIIVSVISLINSAIIYRNRTWKECLGAMEKRLNSKINEIKIDLKEDIDRLEKRVWDSVKGREDNG